MGKKLDDIEEANAYIRSLVDEDLIRFSGLKFERGVPLVSICLQSELAGWHTLKDIETETLNNEALLKDGVVNALRQLGKNVLEYAGKL